MELLAFVGVAAVVIVTPGVDMALVARNALLHGRDAGLATAIGVNVGVAVWAIAAAVGVAAIVRASAEVFLTLKLLGAAYLIVLGIRALFERVRPNGDEPARLPLTTADALRQGVISNVLNPKIGLFFTALLPQFASADAGLLELLTLGAVFNLMGIAWLVTYALLLARGRELLRRRRIRALMDRVTGGLLIGLGIRIALERRPAI